MTAVRRRIAGPKALFALGLLLLAWPTGQASAQNYTAVIDLGMNLGNVAAGKTGDTTFRIDPATGAVIRLAGTAARTSASAARALVTITCSDAGDPGSCAASNVNVLVGPTGTPTGRARPLTGFRISMGTAIQAIAPSGSNPVSFAIGPVGTGAGKTFHVGADFPIAGDNSGQSSGNSLSSFFVFVAKAPATPTTGAIGTAGAVVFRSLTVAKTADLVFGRITRPATGSGTVTYDAVTGLRTVTGGGGSLPLARGLQHHR